MPRQARLFILVYNCLKSFPYNLIEVRSRWLELLKLVSL